MAINGAKRHHRRFQAVTFVRKYVFSGNGYSTPYSYLFRKFMFVLGAAGHCLAVDVLDYQDKHSLYRQDKNQLHVSIHVKDRNQSSMITAGLLATHELSTLGNWFGQVASGIDLRPIVLLEPGLFFDVIAKSENLFTVQVSMSAEASPTWANTPFYAEPFDMQFELDYNQMLLAARQLQELHRQFPSQ